MTSSTRDGDEVIARIEALHAPYRVRLPDEVAAKYRKMAADAYGYFRGTAPLFHEAVQGLRSAFTGEPAHWLLLNGDVHLQNFGTRRDASGVAVFDLADFDEAGYGPVVHDVWRLATSLVLAARLRGVAEVAIDGVLGDLARHYASAFVGFAGDRPSPAHFRLTTDATEGHVRKRIAKLATKSRAELLASVGSGAKWAAVPRSRWPAFAAALAAYRDSLPDGTAGRLDDHSLLAVHERRGAGNGSLGRHRYHLRVAAGEAGELILEFKEQAASALRLPASGEAQAALPVHHGQRVAAAIRRLQTHPDPRTGWTTLEALPFLVREKSPFEADLDCDKLDKPAAWRDVARYTAQVLAKTHALGSPGASREAVALRLAAAPEDFSGELREVARRQAAQTEAEHRAFRRWQDEQR